MGCAKWPHGSGEYFYYWGRPSPTLTTEIWALEWVKMTENHQNFLFSGMELGCPIEWAYGGDHFWYSDRLVNSAISGSNRADRPRCVGKFSLLPLKILFFAQGRKNWFPAPNEPLAGHGASGTNFFDRQGLRASLTQTLKNEEPSRAPPKNALAFYKLSFFAYLTCVWLWFLFVSLPPLSFFSNSI